MKNSHWSFTTIENGKPVETVRGLSHDEAVEAIRASMYGSPQAERIEATIAAKREREQVAELIAA
jgi:hypothetical protein